MDFRLETQYRAGGLASLSDIWGDFIIYRRLQPADPRLPSLEDLRPILGLREKTLPRKTDPHYGRFVAELLRRARRLDLPGQSIERLVYIGDTQMNDGTAFLHICAAGRWPGWAFIGQEEMTRPPRVQVLGRLYLANRWSSLFDFIEQLEKDQGFGLDEATAVVVDMDKTAIGAKGRNDRVIDRVRLESIRRTLADCLGPGFDNRAFEAAYAELKQPAYHSFTADNQDYLAYICLMLGAGLCGLEELAGQVRSGAMRCGLLTISSFGWRNSGLTWLEGASAPCTTKCAVASGKATPLPSKSFGRTNTWPRRPASAASPTAQSSRRSTSASSSPKKSKKRPPG